ncbi:laccase [Coprinopsis marcescibilis]|uniref:Laccase n=1 Tax=Coprinopsis marcescibilis TaxID=230819 RepID=A0A5C3LAS5_COPMA|nr:laccase [Coprinopsis marcescibilis]
MAQPPTGIMGPVGTMTVTNKIVGPDGFRRPVIVVNDLHPGPLVTGQKGDNFDITVVNNLEDSTMLRQTSVHWHGLFQHQSAWADGPEGVTQCPISQSGESFRYTFTGGQEAGTYWYHSHFGTQYCDGLRGPMVVYDPQDPHLGLYDVDDATTILTLTDWYHLQAPALQAPARPDATLINGKGRQPGNTNAELAIVNVEEGKRYRIRLISLSCDPNYVFSIDEHEMTIIEVDGQNIAPVPGIQRIRIFTAVKNYWIRSLPNLGNNGLAGGFTGGINSAVLRYSGAASAEPTTPQWPNTSKVLDETELHPLINAAAPGGSAPADVHLNLALAFNAGTRKWTVDGKSWTSPPEPVMAQMMAGIPPEQLLPAGSIRTLPRNAVVEVSLPALVTGGPHPFHLHGHAFSVVRSAGSSIYNYDNPVRRDVVSIGNAGDNVTIRFITDNPGPWFFHCHIEFHLHDGLAMVFAEAPEAIAEQAPPAEWNTLCDRFNALPESATRITAPTPVPQA